MKILIADQKKAFCLHIPLGLLCNRVGAALLASGFRMTKALPDGAGGAVTVEKGLITTAQMHGLLKALKQSQKTLKQSGLPLVDIEEKDGSRFMITL